MALVSPYTAGRYRKGYDMTKYAEWITQPCGKCRLHVDIGSVLEDDIDPECDVHRTFRCAVCGETADKATIAHGTLGSRTHRPVAGTGRGTP